MRNNIHLKGHPMKNTLSRAIPGLVAALFLSPLSIAHAATALSGCDFDGDGVEDAATVERGRVVRSPALPQGALKLDARYKQVSCSDTDGDGIDEVIVRSRTKQVAFAAPPVTKARNLRKVCKNIRSLYRGEIYKSIASHHINDQRKSSTSFITLRNTRAPAKNCLYGFDKNGTLVHKLGRYFPTGVKYSSRYYGGHGCGDLKSAALVAAIARRNSGSPEIYITSGTGNCARVADANRCYNSSGC